jgi:hypothetical protein
MEVVAVTHSIHPRLLLGRTLTATSRCHSNHNSNNSINSNSSQAAARRPDMHPSNSSSTAARLRRRGDGPTHPSRATQVPEAARWLRMAEVGPLPSSTCPLRPLPSPTCLPPALRLLYLFYRYEKRFLHILYGSSLLPSSFCPLPPLPPLSVCHVSLVTCFVSLTSYLVYLVQPKHKH